MQAPSSLEQMAQSLRDQAAQIALGGGEKAIARQHEKGRLAARERIGLLCDSAAPLLELSQFAAWE